MHEYIIHGTNNESLLNILLCGYIDINRHNPVMIENDIKQIFTQIIYKDLPYNEFYTPHYGNCAIILDKKILKDYAFYSTQIGSFYDKFENAFKDKDNSNKIYEKSKGKLKRLPSLKKLKIHIEEYLIKWGTSDKTGFMYSHEILFNKKIYLKDYCKCIIFRLDETTKTIPLDYMSLANKLNIPIKTYVGIDKKTKTYFPYGLNNFIDLIES